VIAPAIVVRDVDKAFVLHAQGGVRLRVLRGAAVTVRPGECVALADPSGAGKSTLLRLIYGTYRADAGTILVRDGGELVDVVRASPRQILDLRRRTVGHVTQFLRVVPRVPTVDVVTEPLRALGLSLQEATARAERVLARLGVPDRLWRLSPATFSGGEQQRINVARGLVSAPPILLLDEPTASLDAASRAAVVALIREARQRGAAIIGTFHDVAVRDALATRVVTLGGTEAA
jgi:alpha-D-ribose 1-methylphosphonate 5-triphosphate synthase subunit PhnL